MADREEKKKKGKEIEDKRKMIPLFLMLLAAAIFSVLAFVLHFDLKRTLVLLIVVLVLFYSLGSLLLYVLLLFERQNAKAAFDEGEVIEKEAAEKQPREEGAQAAPTAETAGTE